MSTFIDKIDLTWRNNAVGVITDDCKLTLHSGKEKHSVTFNLTENMVERYWDGKSYFEDEPVRMFDETVFEFVEKRGLKSEKHVRFEGTMRFLVQYLSDANIQGPAGQLFKSMLDCYHYDTDKSYAREQSTGRRMPDTLIATLDDRDDGYEI